MIFSSLVKSLKTSHTTQDCSPHLPQLRSHGNEEISLQISINEKPTNAVRTTVRAMVTPTSTNELSTPHGQNFSRRKSNKICSKPHLRLPTVRIFKSKYKSTSTRVPTPFPDSPSRQQAAPSTKPTTGTPKRKSQRSRFWHSSNPDDSDSECEPRVPRRSPGSQPPLFTRPRSSAQPSFHASVSPQNSGPYEPTYTPFNPFASAQPTPHAPTLQRTSGAYIPTHAAGDFHNSYNPHPYHHHAAPPVRAIPASHLPPTPPSQRDSFMCATERQRMEFEKAMQKLRLIERSQRASQRSTQIDDSTIDDESDVSSTPVDSHDALRSQDPALPPKYENVEALAALESGLKLN